MARKLILVAALAASAILSGCASVPMASPEQDAQAKTFPVAPGMSNIYVYRNETMGAAVKLPLELDGKYVGQTASKTYFALQVQPGRHTLVSRSENDSSLDVVAVAGQTHFVWQEIKMGLLQARVQLHSVDDTTGRAGVAECKLAQTAP